MGKMEKEMVRSGPISKNQGPGPDFAEENNKGIYPHIQESHVGH